MSSVPTTSSLPSMSLRICVTGEAEGLHLLVAVLGTNLGTEHGENDPNKRDVGETGWTAKRR